MSGFHQNLAAAQLVKQIFPFYENTNIIILSIISTTLSKKKDEN